MNILSVSTYSLREQLGPVRVDFVDGDGNPRTFALDHPRLLSLADMPARLRDDLGVTAMETVAFQFPALDAPELDDFETALAVSGVELLNVALDIGDLLTDDDAARAADLAELERWIERFAGMGARFVRVNPGSPFSRHHGATPPASLVAALRELGVFARAQDTRLLVENHGGPSSDPTWMLALLDAVGPEHLGLLLDLGNFDALLGPMMGAAAAARAGEDVDRDAVLAALDLSALYAGIEALAPRAELVHVKAHLVGDDGSVGPVDLPRALGILAAHGYDGPLTVEYEGDGGDPWARTRRVLELTAESAASTPTPIRAARA